MRVLTWNLKHGRSVPSAGRNLFEEFASALAGWEWDVALLQEVPPWWPAELAEGAGALQRHVLTSRNSLPAARRFVAVRWPDVAKSNGGGSNAILARAAGVLEHRFRRVSLWPERRWVHAVRLEQGILVANLHLQGSVAQALAAASAASAWAGSSPLVLGGDFNLRAGFELPGFAYAGGSGVDHVLVRGLTADGSVVLDRGGLSDHAPVAVDVSLRPPASSAPAP